LKHVHTTLSLTEAPPIGTRHFANKECADLDTHKAFETSEGRFGNNFQLALDVETNGHKFPNDLYSIEIEHRLH